MLDKTVLLDRITQTPGKCGGRPCIRGMRIRVSDILETLADNVPASEILADFPDLEPEDIQACLLFAALRIICDKLRKSANCQGGRLARGKIG
ncbi:DUF433 domain-containing protein [Microcoleus sp. N9_A1]|uniref:DUF433 domain-containing protein n=1 Tax=Microcoleus sp. N9_A1 TaxID=3055380 RepID=UPI002FD20DD7